jgi:V/A-type H+-transporting ATPase subunit I
MKKVHLAVQDKTQEEALIRLRELGVLHLEKTNAASDKLAKANEQKARVENALGLISSYKTPKKKTAPQMQGGPRERRARPTGRRGRRAEDLMGVEELEPYSLDAVNAPTRPELVNYMLGVGKELKELEDRCAALSKERVRIAGWGEFDPNSIKELESSGVPIFLYELTPEAFEAIPPDARYIKINEDKVAVRLLSPYKEIPGYTPFRLPESSLSGIDAELEELGGKLEVINARIKSFADRRPVLVQEIAVVQGEVEFESARAEFAQIEGIPPDYGISYLTGYVPAEDMGRLKAAAAENGWALTADDPGPEDAVPTKLKNNRFVRLLSPLTDFLEVTPGYNEVDISGFFLVFFTIFFGMIFGDAGYGAIILFAAIFGIFKTMKKGVPTVFKLMLLLGISNFVWGVLTCTWFGVDAPKLPAFFQNISFTPISNVTAAQSDQANGLVRQNLMIFCFSLAVVQLCIGHIISITRLRTLKILAELGSISMLVGMYGVVLILIASNEYRNLSEYIPMMPCVYALGIGFVVNFVFLNYDGSIGKSILESLKNIISMILGIANVFSDIMSYIRLWAVGLAGGAISSTVVTMAGPMLGHFIFFIFGVVLLVFGHGLNLVLNVLSVLVHGVRLNTLEFSGHVGLTWAGTAYKPFRKGAE